MRELSVPIALEERLPALKLLRLGNFFHSVTGLGVGILNIELWVRPLLSLLLGYALGSIPFGVLLTRVAGAGDLRQIGSGNIGATNVLRTGRKGLAALTLLLDGAKGAVAVLIAAHLAPGTALIAAAGAFFGHLYPVWLRFKGGKGVATLFGVMLALHWPSALVYGITWLSVLALTRYSSVAGLTAALIARWRRRRSACSISPCSISPSSC